MSKLIVVDPNSPVNTSKQYYWCRGLSVYSNQLNTNQDIEVKDVLSCWNVVYVLDTNGEKIFDTNGDYIVTITEI